MDAHTIAAHPRAPGRVYVVAGDGYGNPGNGYAESRDAGLTWTRHADGLRHHYLWSIAVDPADPDTVVVSGAHGPREAHDYRAAEAAIYRRRGQSAWEEARVGLPETRGALSAVLAANPAEPGVFYAGSNHGLYRSADAGETWERLEVPWPDERRRDHPEGLSIVT
jgi:hypothetical protein